MEPALLRAASTSKPRRSRWRIAALGAAVTVTLAACGAGAASTSSTSTPTTPTSAAPSAAVTPTPGATAAPDPPATTAVGIINFKFTPAALTVKVGTTVVWSNNDAIAHTVNFMTAGINSSVLNQNDKFSHTFTTPGTYDYICSIHPFMHGSVTVTA